MGPVRASGSTRGATLLEVVVATIVLGIAVPPLVALYAGVSARNVDGTLQAIALAHADSLLEEIASKPFEDPDLGSGSFGTEEVSRADYDDVDDFDGLVESPAARFNGTLLDEYTGFTRSVTVVNVTSGAPDALVPEADGSTDLKRVKVTVTWTGGKGGELTLTTMRSNLGPMPSASPLDEAASVATAYQRGKGKQLALSLVSISDSAVVIETFDLSANAATSLATKLKLATVDIWTGGTGVALPIVGTALNLGTAGNRTIAAGGSPEMIIEWSSAPTGTFTYSLELYFTDGSSSLLTIPFTW